MKSKADSHKMALFGFQRLPDPMVNEAADSFREFSRQIDEGLKRLEERMLDFQRPATRTIGKRRPR